ncbi:DUF1048 domain-containing protein [Enterococcus canis]|nr:DUF1048 domain-containing protein [Enterococcus canis]
MMNFYDKITGNDMTLALKEYDKRVEQLPEDYQTAWKTIQARIWKYSDFTGRNLMPILAGILGLLEESAAEELPIEAVIGENIDAFTADIASAEDASDYRDRLRKQLNQTVTRKLKGVL